MDEFENQLLQEQIRKQIIELSGPHVDEKIPVLPLSRNKLIQELKEEILALKREMIIREGINSRMLDGLMKSKHTEIDKLLSNPIITFPSGKQIMVSDLNAEQLAYLESLSNTIQRK